MNNELCAIKGSSEGLVITINDAEQFPKVLESLKRHLSSAQSFFRGSSAKLALKRGALTEKQLNEVEQLIAEFGMILDPEPPKARTFSDEAHKVAEAESVYPPNDNTLLVRRTIRSGQRLHYDGNVVVMGDVNAGAEIVCSGDILVMGSLRGVAHAGAEGNDEAIVFAFRLEPTQLRIAHLISRAPDGKLPEPEGPEIARVVGNIIQLSTYN
ncbi:MAG: septum site-determining protein MinC [Bacillota bacterium]|nr:septum site-determining protein MinC [Bacillota bacterium]HHU60703.1 septum site-determining protein MinC [Natronincola sp.]